MTSAVTPRHRHRAVVIIPHLNDVTRLDTCLGALIAQPEAHPVTGRVDIIVVDNGSSQDITPLIAKFPSVRFAVEPVKGAAAARNRGVAETSAPLLFFTDADCVPGPDWLRVGLELMESLAPPFGIIGGAVKLFDETPPPRNGAQVFETVFAFAQRRYVTRKGFSVTANLLTTRAVYDLTGPFDGTQAEDVDWCRRAGLLGVQIAYRPALEVAHPTRGNGAELIRKWRRLTSEAFRTNGLSAAARIMWFLRAFAVLGSGVLHLPRVLGHPGLSVREKRRGAVTLLALRTVRAGWMLRQSLFGARI